MTLEDVVARVLESGVEPAERRVVVGEPVILPDVEPFRWERGAALRGIVARFRGQDSTPVPDAVEASSAEVWHAGRKLREGADYLLDPVWGMLGMPAGRRAPGLVTVDYTYSLLRLDSVTLSPEGEVGVVRGRSHLAAPHPPSVPDGHRRLANVLVPYRSDGQSFEVYRIKEGVPSSPSQVHWLPKVHSKLRARQDVRIVCWGDSITAGWDSSSDASSYPGLLESRLHRAYPGASVNVSVAAVAGSTSRMWIDDAGNGCSWRRIEEARPDLVTLEFVNDSGLVPGRLAELYAEILARVQELGAELCLITPSFTMPAMMGPAPVSDSDPRPYTAFLRRLAREREVALADVSARWEHLASEGIPHRTLLNNGINHPDDRGHEIFAEVLVQALRD